MMNVAIILSGGIGRRMGCDIPKQYLLVGDKPIFVYCLETCMASGLFDQFIIVADPYWRKEIEQYIKKGNTPFCYALPGKNRQHSIYNALKAGKDFIDFSDIVLIHDAVRPLVSEQLLKRCIDECWDCDGVLPVLPVKDTIYLSDTGGDIAGLLDRNRLYAGQAPEAFRFGTYLTVHDTLSYEDILSINGSTEIAYKAGLQIKLVEGEETNFKITTIEDLNRFKQIVT